MEFARRMLPVLLLAMLILPIYDVAGTGRLRVEHKMMKRITEETCDEYCDNHCKNDIHFRRGICGQYGFCYCYP
ncbi:hypothetical protein MA16_Dca004472 [Dendrobium catenatum]|uniref:Uncharacterized protein n=1 Tax=Dendrobium catenatum TaxID=906689 RepID=A0A2I0W7L1_9ASPA|nr:hypothetical protein MA16_Dca004472 [Dendrobium catenatum]